MAATSPPTSTWFAAVGVAGAGGGDDIGADADVVEGYGMGLNVGDEGGEAGGPAAVGVAGPAAGGGGFAEGDECAEFGGVAVFVHEGSVLYGHLKGLTSAHSRGAVLRPSEGLRHRYGETLEMTSGNFAVHARRW